MARAVVAVVWCCLLLYLSGGGDTCYGAISGYLSLPLCIVSCCRNHRLTFVFTGSMLVQSTGCIACAALDCTEVRSHRITRVNRAEVILELHI